MLAELFLAVWEDQLLSFLNFPVELDTWEQGKRGLSDLPCNWFCTGSRSLMTADS